MYVLTVSSSERHQVILDRLQDKGAVEVFELAQELKISPITVRRDLDQLAVRGVLRRIRGGAVSLMLRGEGLPFVMREIDDAGVKDRMGEAVGGLLIDGEAVAIDSGTTGAAVARAVANRRLTVMPFSVQALTHLAGSASVEILLPGGSVRREEGSFVGPLVESTLRVMRFDSAVLTCCGVSEAEGVMAHDLQDAAAKRAMSGAARRTILVAEGAKFARSAMAVVTSLATIDVLVTDGTAPAEVLRRLEHAGVQVVIV